MVTTAFLEPEVALGGANIVEEKLGVKSRVTVSHCYGGLVSKRHESSVAVECAFGQSSKEERYAKEKPMVYQ